MQTKQYDCWLAGPFPLLERPAPVPYGEGLADEDWGHPLTMNEEFRLNGTNAQG